MCSPTKLVQLVVVKVGHFLIGKIINPKMADLCYELSCCPQCHQGISTSTNRLVQDSCGHKKCRMCLLQEDNGCVTCRNVSRYADENDFSPTPLHEMQVFAIDRQHINESDSPHQMSEINTLHTSNDYNEHYHDDTGEQMKFQSTYSQQNLRNNVHNRLPPSEVWRPETEESCSNEVHTMQHTVSPMSHPVESSLPSNLPSENIGLVSKAEISISKPKVKTKRKPLVIPDFVTVSDDCPPTYTCTICSKTFKARLHVRYHQYCDGSKKPFKCKICDQEFISKSHYEYHLRNHEGNRPYICETCKKAFNQQGKLTRHLRCHSAERTFVCSICGRAFKNLDGLKNHKRTHTGNKPHRCTLCSKKFSALASLKKHAVTHTGEKNFMCDECGLSFSLKCNLSIHIAMHSQANPYRCSTCSRVFGAKKDLQRHYTTHSSNRPFVCPLCSLAFRRKDNFQRHMKNNHPQSNLPPTIKSKPEPVTNPQQNQILSPSQKDDVTSANLPTVHTTLPSHVSNISSNSNHGDTVSFLKNKNIDIGSGYIANNDSNAASIKKADIVDAAQKSPAREILFMAPESPITQGTLSIPSTSQELNTSERLGMKQLPNDNTNFTSPDTQCEQSLNKEIITNHPLPEPIITVDYSKSETAPPKTLSYQAVSVINRLNVSSTSNVSAPSYESNVIKLGSRSEICEPSNCVRTITRTYNVQSPRELPKSEVLPKLVPSCEALGPEWLGEGYDNPEKPTLRLYLSDVHWRKRMMELLNLKKEPTTDSLVYKGSDRTNDCLKERLVLNKKDNQICDARTKAAGSHTRKGNTKTSVHGHNSKYTRTKQASKTISNKSLPKSRHVVPPTKPGTSLEIKYHKHSSNIEGNSEEGSSKSMSILADAHEPSTLPQVINAECVIVENTSIHH